MIKRSDTSNKRLPKDIGILYEDGDIIVVVKPFGLLTMGTDRDKSRTLYSILTDYVRKGYSKSPKRIFIVHRLDRDTSRDTYFRKEHGGQTAAAGPMGRNREEIYCRCSRQV